jgi:two-component system osmolarity sensor histidine kinase EnvZ
VWPWAAHEPNIAIAAILLTGFLLLNVLSFALMQRHWDVVARCLSESMARDMTAIVHLYEASSTKDDIARFVDIGLTRLGLSVEVLPTGNLPPPQPKPFFDVLDSALADEIRTNIKRPFWIDTVGSCAMWRFASSSTVQSCASSLHVGKPISQTLSPF